MRKVLVVIVLFLAAIVVLGFFRGWFRLSTDHTAAQRSTTFTVDQNKINEDKDKVTGKVQDFEHKTREETAGSGTEKVK